MALDYHPTADLELRLGDRVAVLTVRIPSARALSQFVRAHDAEAVSYTDKVEMIVAFLGRTIVAVDGGTLFGADYRWPATEKERIDEVAERWPATAIDPAKTAVLVAAAGGAADEGKFVCGPRSSRATGTAATSAPTT